jgi:protease-4
MDPILSDHDKERRRKWRRSAFWKGFFVALAVIGAGIAFAGWRGEDADGSARLGRQQIARYQIDGVIADDPDRDRMLAALARDSSVRGLVLRINSPGGTTAGSEALYDSIRRIAATRPVVAQLTEVAASGGYVAAIAADHIVARGNTLTGSIGVIMEYPNFTDVMSRLGVGWETVRSSELKAEPSPFRPTNPEARALDEALVQDGFRWFRDLVGERRGLEGPSLDAVATGAAFSGRLALDAGLVDEIGGEPEAIAWLESREPDLAGLPVRDWEVESNTGWVRGLLGSAGTTSGILGEISRLTGPKLYSLGP